MPIYEYTCPACSAHFEKLLLRTDQPVACPSCGDAHPQRRLSSFSFASGGSSAASSPCEGGACSPCGGGMCGWN